MFVRLVILLFFFGSAMGVNLLSPDPPDQEPQSFPGTSVSPVPSCFTPDTTWSTHESTATIPDTDNFFACQEHCLQSTICDKFTWYNELAMPFDSTCILFDHPTTEYDCSNCVSGPQSCTCSAIYSCKFTDNFIGEFHDVEMEDLCQDHCIKTDQCNFYSWFEEDSFPKLCLMFSSCEEKEFHCNTCHSGPANCEDVSVMTSTSTPIATTTSPYLSCFDEETTWSFDEVTSISPSVYSAISCQELCQNNTLSCSDFTWYSEDAAPLPHLCTLFLNPSTTIPCPDCVSGPLSCTCGAQFACEVNGNNVIDIITSINTEILCQEECAQVSMCTFYTYFDISSHPFNQTCVLFSSCDKVDFSCQGCSSGPDDCRNISRITTLHPTSPPTTTTTTTTPPTTSVICDLPEQKHGYWFCPPSSESATCHLECHPGYVSDNGTIITCLHGEWSSAPTCVGAVALITGRAYPSPYNTVEIYGEGLHKKLPNLPDNRRYHSLQLVNSAVLICGGDNTRTSCLVLTSSQQWTSHSSTTFSRYYHSSVSMLGNLHLLGGYTSRSTTEHLTPPSHQWSQSWDLLEDTDRACAAKIEPQVFILTGEGLGNYQSSVISYNVTSGASTRLQDLITPRYFHGCVYVRDPGTGLRGVLVAGGYGGDSSSEIYDITSGEWTTTGELTSSRQNGVRMVVLEDNILAMGGDDGGALSTVDRFNMTSMEWRATENMLEARAAHAVTGVPPGAVGMDQN